MNPDQLTGTEFLAAALAIVVLIGVLGLTLCIYAVKGWTGKHRRTHRK